MTSCWQSRENESFSDELERLVDKEEDIMDLAGSWDISEEEATKFKKTIAEMRKSSRLSDIWG